MEHVSKHVRAHSPSHSGAHYSAQDIADEHPDIQPSEVTVRTRWFAYIKQVAPDGLLKDKDGFTELARSLFDDFIQQVKREGQNPKEWVKATKTRYSHEWESAGVIDAELMPDEVGGALATLRQSGSSLQQQISDELDQLQQFAQQIQDVEDDFSEAEIELFKAKGAMRGVKRFRIETQSELEVYSQLKRQNLNNQQ
ncbi:MAG: hypothetical protein ACFE0J_22270 [Elainellaceae cyanobacterium]